MATKSQQSQTESKPKVREDRYVTKTGASKELWHFLTRTHALGKSCRVKLTAKGAPVYVTAKKGDEIRYQAMKDGQPVGDEKTAKISKIAAVRSRRTEVPAS